MGKKIEIEPTKAFKERYDVSYECFSMEVLVCIGFCYYIIVNLI